jgi:hypothetical protein
MNQHPRMRREARTMQAMVQIYCRGRHATRGELCPQCRSLLEYAYLRLDKCPFQEEKTTCAQCPIHCYRPAMREQVREVMRYAGPRMIYRHPVLAIRHMLDGRRKEPVWPPHLKRPRTQMNSE